MIGRITDPSGGEQVEPEEPGRRSWMGLATSLALHALFFTVVWVFTGLSFNDDVRDEPVRIVRLVPGDRDGAITTSSPSRSTRRPDAARPIARPAASRAKAQPKPALVSAPVPAQASEPPAPEPLAVPETTPPQPAATEPPVPEPSPAAPVAAAAVPVAPQEAAAATPEPGGQPPATPPASVADAAIAPNPEDAPPVTVEGPRRLPDLAWLQAVTSEPTVAARANGEPFLGRREVFEFL